MGEPATSHVGAIVGALAVATLATLGVHPQPLFWALAGAVLGMSMAPASVWWREALVFACVVLLSALLGTAAAARWADGSLVAADTIAALTAWLFHPLAGVLVARAPQLLVGWMERWSAGKPPQGGGQGDKP